MTRYRDFSFRDNNRMMLVSFMIAYHDAELIFNKQRKQLYICIYKERKRSL